MTFLDPVNLDKLYTYCNVEGASAQHTATEEGNGEGNGEKVKE